MIGMTCRDAMKWARTLSAHDRSKPPTSTLDLPDGFLRSRGVAVHNNDMRALARHDCRAGPADAGA
jgi:hypothetical protein